MSDHYNETNYPHFVARNCEAWDIRANATGTSFASVAVKDGHLSSGFGTPFYLATLMRDYQQWNWEISAYGREILKPYHRICGEVLDRVAFFAALNEPSCLFEKSH